MSIDPGHRIVCAAIRNDKGTVICGVRHYDTLMHTQIGNDKTSYWPCSTVEQGFVDNKGQFLTREEAWSVAWMAEQIIRQVATSGTLYSENLY